MIRRPPRSTRVRSSAASDVYKRQAVINTQAGERSGSRLARPATTAQDVPSTTSRGMTGASSACNRKDRCHMVQGVTTSPVSDDLQWVLSDEALEFVADLHRTFDERRIALLIGRQPVAGNMRDGKYELGFLDETADVRAGDWSVAPAPADLNDRRAEITGPCDRKMVINALNSGAKVFMADLEDASSPI